MMPPMEKGPARSRASVSVTFAVGFSRGLGRFVYLHSGSVAAHSLNAPYPLRDRPCRAVQQQPCGTLLHFREVQRLCCDHYLPLRLHNFSSQRATTRRTPRRSQESRNGVMKICRKFHQYSDMATAVRSPGGLPLKANIARRSRHVANVAKDDIARPLEMREAARRGGLILAVLPDPGSAYRAALG
jgi:hypothetical protein